MGGGVGSLLRVTDAARPARARALLQELRDSIPQDMRGLFDLEARSARAWIAVAEDRLQDASVEFRRSDASQAMAMRRSFALGLVHDRMAESDSAIAHYERFLTTPSYARWTWDPRWLGFVLERLGQLHEERGDAEQAVEHYTRFVELWRDADPELRPRVEAARVVVARLAGGA